MQDVHPPAPVLSLVIGVTGHRRLGDGEDLRAAFVALLDRAHTCIRSIHERCRWAFSGPAASITVLSQLAEGADQLAAEAALDRGHAIDVIVPFELSEFRENFTSHGKDKLDELRERANVSWTLPCSGDAAYRLAGESMVAQADLVVAMWDGMPAKGPGGTAEVVSHAIRRDVPVIHLPVGGGAPRILWAGFEGVSGILLDPDTVPSRPFDDASLAEVLERLLAPPQDPEERNALEQFLGEHERRVRTRLEFPLLLALMQVRKLSAEHFRSKPFLASTAHDWAGYHERLPTGGLAGEVLGRSPIESHFAWSDRLADHYAQAYRSGAIFNFAAAAASILLALFGFVLPTSKLWLVLAELLIVGMLILNTYVGNRREWHRRWLEYRYLAETLRPMRSLKLVSAARPMWRGATADRGRERWTDWYAMAVWRNGGAPPTIRSAGEVRTIAAHIAVEELAPQVAYHRLNAWRMHHLDHRLHLAGTTLFILTLVSGVTTLLGQLLAIEAVHAARMPLSILSAALPTIGAAIFGIRGQGDFAGAARRSLETAVQLDRQSARLNDPGINLPLLSRITEEAAGTMIADLNEWRLSYRDRRLAIPA